MPANTTLATILIIDDETKIREGLRDYFEDMGYLVLTAGSGEEGLKTLEAWHADVCTVDIRLPGMNGNEFIQTAHVRWPELKFLVYTGSAGYDLPCELKDLAVVPENVFFKPVERQDTLTKAVERLLGAGRVSSR